MNIIISVLKALTGMLVIETDNNYIGPGREVSASMTEVTCISTAGVRVPLQGLGKYHCRG